MRDLPLMGKPLDEQLNWQCGYVGPDPKHSEPHCLADGKWHGIVLDDNGVHIVAMMTSCDEHVSMMKLTADYVHPHRHPCAIPGAWFRWPENECYIDWGASELILDGALEGQVA